MFQVSLHSAILCIKLSFKVYYYNKLKIDWPSRVETATYARCKAIRRAKILFMPMSVDICRVSAKVQEIDPLI